MDEVLAALSRVRVPVVLEETKLHERIALALDEAGIAYQREHRVGRCRLDFLCQGGVAIEVKRGRPEHRLLLEQMQRYAQLDEVTALIAACEAAVRLPKTIGGKPCASLPLRALWGVALP